MQVENILHALQLNSADHNILIHLLSNWLVRLHKALPMHPFFGYHIEAVIESITLVGKFGVFGSGLHPTIEGSPIVRNLESVFSPI
jgi:hypothetical protein